MNFLGFKQENIQKNQYNSMNNSSENTGKTINIAEFSRKPLNEYVKELNLLEKMQQNSKKNGGFIEKNCKAFEGKSVKNDIKTKIFKEKEQVLLSLSGKDDKYKGKSECFIGEKLQFSRVDREKSSFFSKSKKEAKNLKNPPNINYENYKVSKKYSHIVGNMARTAKVQNLFNISQTQLMIIKRKNSKNGLISPCEAVKSFYKSMLVKPKSSRYFQEFFIIDEK